MRFRYGGASLGLALLLCSCGSSSSQVANVALCHDYVKWASNQSSSSAIGHKTAEFILHGHATNPVKRDVSRALVYYALWSGNGSGSLYLTQSLDAEGAAFRACDAIGVKA